MSTIIFTYSEKGVIHVYIDELFIKGLAFVCSGVTKKVIEAKGRKLYGEEVIGVAKGEFEIVMLDNPYRCGVLRPKLSRK